MKKPIIYYCFIFSLSLPSFVVSYWMHPGNGVNVIITTFIWFFILQIAGYKLFVTDGKKKWLHIFIAVLLSSLGIFISFAYFIYDLTH
jgi:CHASE2 domain-containing sensor protein